MVFVFSLEAVELPQHGRGSGHEFGEVEDCFFALIGSRIRCSLTKQLCYACNTVSETGPMLHAGFASVVFSTHLAWVIRTCLRRDCRVRPITCFLMLVLVFVFLFLAIVVLWGPLERLLALVAFFSVCTISRFNTLTYCNLHA